MLGSRGHTQLGTTGLSQDAQGLLVTVTGEEGTLLGIAHRNTETGGDIAGEIESGVVQELVGDLDHRAQFIGGQSGLTELGVGLRDLLTLIDPLRLHSVGRNRDLAGTGIRADDGCELTEDVVLFQGLDQAALKLVGHGIATLGVLTDRQGIADRELVALVADHVPEGVTVLIRSSTLCLRSLVCARHALHRLAGRSGKRSVKRLLLLKALDLCTEGLHVRSHLVVLLHGGSLDQTVLAAMLFQESLGLLPQVCTLVAKFKNLTHGLPLSPEKRSGRYFCFVV